MPKERITELRPTVAACAVGLIVTGATTWRPYVAIGIRNASLHVVLDSVGACIAVLVAYLVYGRFIRRGMLQDLLIGHCLVFVAVAGLCLTYLQGIQGFRSGKLDVWLPLGLQALGSLLIGAAAVSNRSLANQLALRRLAVLSPMAVIAVTFLALPWIAMSQPSASFGPAQHTMLTGYSLLPVAQGLTALGFFVASVAFTFQAGRRKDELLRWLGPACALGSFARINDVLVPSRYTDWVNTSDLLRTGFYVLLLVGATREINQYWSAQAGLAVSDDRRRLARELHDGVIQELAYIRSECHTIPAGMASGNHIIRACDRALDEARAAVHALGRASEEPLGFVLCRTTTELAERYEVNVEVDLDNSVSVASDQQHALLRITREAVANAVHHGKARRVRIRLSQDGGCRLTIEDDGQGFDVSASVAATAGYGLISMRERALALPGSFTVEAHSGIGSVVTVLW
jgi:signal transduction histidine kinase